MGNGIVALHLSDKKTGNKASDMNLKIIEFHFELCMLFQYFENQNTLRTHKLQIVEDID